MTHIVNVITLEWEPEVTGIMVDGELLDTTWWPDRGSESVVIECPEHFFAALGKALKARFTVFKVHITEEAAMRAKRDPSSLEWETIADDWEVFVHYCDIEEITVTPEKEDDTPRFVRVGLNLNSMYSYVVPATAAYVEQAKDWIFDDLNASVIKNETQPPIKTEFAPWATWADVPEVFQEQWAEEQEAADEA